MGDISSKDILFFSLLFPRCLQLESWLLAKLYFQGVHDIYLGMLDAAYSTIFIAFLFILVPLGFEDKITQN